MAGPSGRDRDLADLLALARQHGIGSEGLDEIVHQVVSEQATQINNGGLEAQLSYLIDALGPTQASAMLHPGTGTRSEPPAGYGMPRQGERL